MATIKELIRTEAAGGISFGNYELDTKTENFLIMNMIKNMIDLKNLRKLQVLF